MSRCHESNNRFVNQWFRGDTIALGMVSQVSPRCHPRYEMAVVVRAIPESVRHGAQIDSERAAPMATIVAISPWHFRYSKSSPRVYRSGRSGLVNGKARVGKEWGVLRTGHFWGGYTKVAQKCDGLTKGVGRTAARVRCFRNWHSRGDWNQGFLKSS